MSTKRISMGPSILTREDGDDGQGVWYFQHTRISDKVMVFALDLDTLKYLYTVWYQKDYNVAFPSDLVTEICDEYFHRATTAAHKDCWAITRSEKENLIKNMILDTLEISEEGSLQCELLRNLFITKRDGCWETTEYKYIRASNTNDIVFAKTYPSIQELVFGLIVYLGINDCKAEEKV